MNNDAFDICTPNFLTQSQKEAQARMLNIVNGNGLGVLSGEIGSGKTTVLRLLASDLQSSKFIVIYICNAGLIPKELYVNILRALGEEPSYTLPKIKQQWKMALESLLIEGKKLVLMIDEAHELPSTTLLELRFILNYNMDQSPVFSVILSGQPRLRSELRLKAYEAIAQRTKMQYHLQGMTVLETGQYIQAKLQQAQLEKPLFAQSAIDIIHSSSQGIPRVVNQICRHALFAATKNSESVIEEKHIITVLADMDRQKGAIV